MSTSNAEDFLEASARSTLTDFDMNPFRGSRFFITGATGLIGSSLTRALLLASRDQHLGIHVTAHVRNEKKAREMFDALPKTNELSIEQGQLGTPITSVEKPDFAIHCAAMTSSRDMIVNPVEVMTTTIDGTRNFLEFAHSAKVQSSIFLSSLEAYGTPAPSHSTVTEADNGQLDTMRPRSSYPEAKRAAECLCAAYASEYGVNVSVARLAQTFGPGVRYDDGRVFADFARSAAEGRNIVLHTAGRTTRNYCHVSDAVRAMLLLLQNGRCGNAYNIANNGTFMSIRELAELFALKSASSKIVFDTSDTESFGYAPEVKILLDISKIEKLGFRPRWTMDTMADEIIQWFRLIGKKQNALSRIQP